MMLIFGGIFLVSPPLLSLLLRVRLLLLVVLFPPCPCFSLPVRLLLLCFAPAAVVLSLHEPLPDMVWVSLLLVSAVLFLVCLLLAV